jgi:hypothetical protein
MRRLAVVAIGAMLASAGCAYTLAPGFHPPATEGGRRVVARAAEVTVDGDSVQVLVVTGGGQPWAVDLGGDANVYLPQDGVPVDLWGGGPSRVADGICYSATRRLPGSAPEEGPGRMVRGRPDERRAHLTAACGVAFARVLVENPWLDPKRGEERGR